MEAYSNEEFAVGCILSIKTTLGDEFDAQVIAFDKPSNILLLQEGVTASGPKRDIRLLKANYIKEFSFLRQGQDPIDTTKCFLDLSSLQAKEYSALRQAEIDAERFGIGVTAEAQNIYDALSKTKCGSFFKLHVKKYVGCTGDLRKAFVISFFFLSFHTYSSKQLKASRLPVRWDKTVIVVMNEVRVSSPYLPESVIGGTPAANERVRKVLELERKRLQSRNTGQ